MRNSLTYQAIKQQIYELRELKAQLGKVRVCDMSVPQMVAMARRLGEVGGRLKVLTCLLESISVEASLQSEFETLQGNCMKTIAVVSVYQDQRLKETFVPRESFLACFAGECKTVFGMSLADLDVHVTLSDGELMNRDFADLAGLVESDTAFSAKAFPMGAACGSRHVEFSVV